LEAEFFDRGELLGAAASDVAKMVTIAMLLNNVRIVRKLLARNYSARQCAFVRADLPCFDRS
jgi:hypothetical protein